MLVPIIISARNIYKENAALNQRFPLNLHLALIKFSSFSYRYLILDLSVTVIIFLCFVIIALLLSQNYHEIEDLLFLVMFLLDM